MSIALETPAEMASAGEPTLGGRAWLRSADRILGRMVEIPAAILVVAEVIILFSGVVARYAFHKPLIWADELSSILFLWLAMTGAAVALHRGAHMRMTALVNRMGERWRPMWEWIALTSCLTFLGLLVIPSFSYLLQQSEIRTPGLNMIDAWRVVSIVVAVVMMVLIGSVKLLLIGPRFALAGLLAAAAVATGLHFTGPLLSDLGNVNLVIFFVGVVGLTVLSGMPIAFSFGLATFSYLSMSTSMPLSVVVGRMDEGVSQLILLAVPMFVFLGLLIEMTGMARTMVAFLASLLGHVRGGLSYVLVGSMYLVSGISGSKAADMAAVAPVLFPEMVKRGARRGELVALLSATGAQTETIPPSIVLITIGSVTGVSITSLFIGGMLPGLVLAFTLCCLIWWRSRKDDMAGHARASWRTVGKTFIAAFPALMLPFVIRFAVVEGIATATEVSTVGIVYSLIVGLLIYRQFDWRRLGPILTETASLSGAILMIIGTATAMAWALTQSGFSQTLAEFMAALPGGKTMFLAVSVLAFITLGSVLEGIPAIVLFGPLLFPIAREVGVNEVQYAMVVILSMGLGLFSPPFGVGYYGACAVSKIHPDEGIRPIVGYMVALFIGIVIVAAVPWVSTGFLK
jgi:tripartite ATP-independent transporter DctM subunit